MEKNKKNILFLFLLFFALSFEVVAQIKDVPVVKLFEKEYYKYEIKPKESLYSICKKFMVTEAEMLSMNPFIVNGLEAGQTLMIPVKSSKVSGEKKEVVVEKDGTIVKALPKDIKAKKPATLSTAKPRITVLLPFALAATPGANDKYIEFYEGLLLAVDSLKSLGLSFEVQALESGNDTEGINHAIITGKLNETDYCIGGTTPEQISMLAKWAKTNQRILILPFSSRIPELDKNPYLFQTNTPHDFMYNRLTEYSLSRIDKSNIIFLKATVQDSDARTALSTKIKSRLQKKGIAFKEVADDDNLDALSSVLSSDRENNIIPSPLTMNETNRLLTRLSAYAKAHPEKKITVAGYPDWQAINKGYQKRLYELNTYIYSNFYADVQKQNVRDFQIRFTKTFGKNLLNSYPKYSMMGYDIAAYFIPRMVFEKTEKLESIPAISPLQNDFQFNSLNPIDGAFNKLMYIIHYKPDYTIEVIPVN